VALTILCVGKKRLTLVPFDSQNPYKVIHCARSPEAQPEQVVMVVVTDGMEHASRHFRGTQVRRMITEKSAKNQWQFVYLSADLHAVNEAEQTGFSQAASMTYDLNPVGVKEAWLSLSQSVKKYRDKSEASVRFSEEDRQRHQSEQQRQKQAQKLEPPAEHSS